MHWEVAGIEWVQALEGACDCREAQRLWVDAKGWVAGLTVKLQSLRTTSLL